MGVYKMVENVEGNRIGRGQNTEIPFSVGLVLLAGVILAIVAMTAP